MSDLVVILIILALQGLWTLITLHIAERVKQAARGAVDESVGPRRFSVLGTFMSWDPGARSHVLTCLSLRPAAFLAAPLLLAATRLPAQQPVGTRTYVIEGALTGPPTGYYDVPLTIPALRAGTYSHRYGLFRLFARGKPGCYELLIRHGYYLRSRYRIELGKDTAVQLGPLRLKKLVGGDYTYDLRPIDPDTLPEDTVGSCTPPPTGNLKENWPVAHLRIEGSVRRGNAPMRGREVWVSCAAFGGERVRTDSLGRFEVDLTAQWPHIAELPQPHAPCFAQVGTNGLYPAARFSALSASVDSAVPVTRQVITLPEPSWRPGQSVFVGDSLFLPGTAAIQSYIGHGTLRFEILPRPKRYSLYTWAVFIPQGWPRPDTVTGPHRYRMKPDRPLPADSVQVLPLLIRITTGVQSPNFGSSLQLVVPDSVAQLLARGHRLQAYARLPKASSGRDDAYSGIRGSYAPDTGIFTISLPDDFADDMRDPHHGNQLELLLGLERLQS